MFSVSEAMDKCNVDCPYYTWDGETTPDSEHSAVLKSIEEMLSALPHKHRKLFNTGRNIPIVKNYVIVGAQRRSTGRDRWF